MESEEQFEECPQRAPKKEDELEEKNSTLEKAESTKEKLAPKVTFKVSTTKENLQALCRCPILSGLLCSF